jgi:hypothetical protein
MQALFSFLREKSKSRNQVQTQESNQKKQIKIVSQHRKEKSSWPITGIGERLKLSTASFRRPKEQLEFF